MTGQLVLVLLTSTLTAFITILAAWLLFRLVLERRLIEEFETRVQNFAQLLEERIGEGVRRGMKKGLSDAAAETVANTPENLTKAGLDLIEGTISTLFGRSPKSKK